jgi:hypothetical protein
LPAFGDVAPAGYLAAGVFAWHQPAEAHERTRSGEAGPVTDLGRQVQGAKAGHAPVGGQAGHLLGERGAVLPDGKVGLDRFQLRVAALQHRPVVVVGRLQRWLGEPLGDQPPLMGQRPRLAGPPDLPVAQQQLAQPMAGPHPVPDHVAPGAAQSRTASSAGVGIRMATSSEARCNLASRRQSRLSVLTRSPGALGISEARSPGS